MFGNYLVARFAKNLKITILEPEILKVIHNINTVTALLLLKTIINYL